MTLRPPARLARLAHAAALAGLLAAGVPVALRVVPSLHRGPSVSRGRYDGRTTVSDQVVRRGLDRYGYVYQERARSWEAPEPASLDFVRGDPGVTDLPPAQSWRLQLTSYGINHVYLPHGVMLAEGGSLYTVPYSLVALVLAAPAAAWAAMAAWRRLRRGGSA
jgi:hypothetical protein